MASDALTTGFHDPYRITIWSQWVQLSIDRSYTHIVPVAEKEVSKEFKYIVGRERRVGRQEGASTWALKEEPIGHMSLKTRAE